ncbi:hypothetical protein CPC16_008056 [Podila verticillata]|nr:hypothetical protein CPC16_008056 [Podila verticillata]
MLQTRKKGISTALALALSSINLAWANVAFVKFANNYVVNPGDPVIVRWTEVVPTNGTVNNDPFDLLLRAYSGQSYMIQRGVAQNLLTVTVNIPNNATGGLHSFRADYTGSGGISSNQLTITGKIVNVTSTTTLPLSTTTTTSTTGKPLTTGEGNKESSGGLSGGALGGIIGGVVALLLLIALIFFFRHRRRVRERSDHSKLNDNKENYGHLSSRDGSVAMTSRSMNGPGPIEPPPQGTNISGPLSVAPNYEKQRPSRDDHSGPHSPQHMQHQGRNPFEEDKPPMGSAASLSPRQQHQPYQPPQMSQPPPRPYQQGPPYNNNINNNNQQGYTLPPHQQDRASPFHGSRDSFESEVESAYDPRVNVNQHGAPAPVMRGGPPMMNEPGLSHSPSGRSNMSDPRFRQGQPMSPAQHHQQQQQQLQQRQAGSMSPMPHRPMTPTNYHHQDPENRSQSPFAGTSRQREIEMQPLDIQQHQLEQQQRVLQRQQQQQLQQQEQQQEQQREQQNQHQVPPLAPARTTLSPFNPTQYDDKAEIDDDGVPVYNGYRDTIFGAYAQTPEDDEDDSEDDRAKVPTPIIPASAMALAGHEAQLKQDGSLEMNGATGVQRKKSVKFTGVPASGPIVVPQAQQDQTKQKPLEAADDHDEEEDEDGYYDDEDDIKMRLMETEVPSPTVSNASANRPAFINTAPGVGSPVLSNNNTHPVLSPVRSLASPTSPYQQHPVSKTSPVLDTSSPFGNGFYEDVLAAVDNHGVASPVSPRQQQQPKLPSLPIPVPRSPESNQHHTQQQHLPPPQAQHLAKEVYGAPSPRMTPASAHQQQQQHHNGNQGPPSPSSARVMSPRTAARQPHNNNNNHGHDDEESAFYESQLL